MAIPRALPLTFVFALALPAGLGGCAAAGERSSQRIEHVVFIKLTDPADADELIAACRREMPAIAGVAACTVGRPLDIGRPEVVNDWDVGLVIEFASKADYQRYLDHPRHAALVAAWEPRWQRITISDIGPGAAAAR